jgi:hypothetical protein
MCFYETPSLVEFLRGYSVCAWTFIRVLVSKAATYRKQRSAAWLFCTPEATRRSLVVSDLKVSGVLHQSVFGPVTFNISPHADSFITYGYCIPRLASPAVSDSRRGMMASPGTRNVSM